MTDSPSSSRLPELLLFVEDAVAEDGEVPEEVVFKALRAAYSVGYMDSLEAGWEERALVAAGLVLNPPL